MGQKVSPIGFRTGIRLGWQSTWFAQKANYGDFLVEDQKIRRYVDRKFNRRMPKGAVAKTEVIRTRNEVKVTLHSARPGVVIGPRGGEVDRLREELEDLTGRKVAVNVIEIKEPDLSATLVAEAIAEQLCKRASFRRAMKQHCEGVMNAGAKGVKIICAGRLAGSEMARRETQSSAVSPCTPSMLMWTTPSQQPEQHTERLALRSGFIRASSARRLSRGILAADRQDATQTCRPAAGLKLRRCKMAEAPPKQKKHQLKKRAQRNQQPITNNQ